MKRLLLVMFNVLAVSAMANPPPNFDARIEALREASGVPGVAVSIVENGHTVLARGYGVRRMGAPEAVDADTIFPTGSTGKAFTVAALATLVDDGRIDWDDKVIDRLPGFQMYDPWVTREMTIRDLLIHRSGLGLGQGDLLFVPRSNIPRAEAVRRLRYLKPATSFRSGYAYDNVLYMVAGQLIEAVTGQSWEDYVREHVLAPAGMKRSTTDSESRYADTNRAFPHARTSQAVRGLGVQQLLDERDELGRSAAPAGGLAISANDMAKWLALQLAHGQLPGGRRLFSEAAHAAMWKPEILLPVAPRSEGLKLTESVFDAYALGWEVKDYRGNKIISHGGAVLGFQSVVVLMPDKNVGFAVQINSEDSEILLGLTYELIDHYLGFPANDWPTRFATYKHDRLVNALTAVEAISSKRDRVGPSLTIDRYAGTYTDPWYGNIEVTLRDGALSINFRSTPRMGGRLEHWQYETFIAHFEDKTIEPAYVTFALDADGRVERVTMKAVSPVADFSFDYHDLHFVPAAPPK